MILFASHLELKLKLFQPQTVAFGLPDGKSVKKDFLKIPGEVTVLLQSLCSKYRLIAVLSVGKKSVILFAGHLELRLKLPQPQKVAFGLPDGK